MTMKFSGRLAIAAILLLAGAAWMVPYGDFIANGARWQFQAAAFLMAAGWLIALTLRSISGRDFWTLAIALRLILLPMQPGIDLHRYIWEGRIQTRGFNPYQHAPNAEALSALRDQNWSEVQFKQVSAIYPPLAELGFRLLAVVSQSALWFKLAFVGVDLLVCLFLSGRFSFARSLLYAWNPLVLYSFAGGAHYDSWFILALVSAWLLWERGGLTKAAALVGSATALKWISLPILVWAIPRVARTKGIRKALIAACIGVLPFLVAWFTVTHGDFHTSLWPKEFVFYAQSFDLIPAVLRWFSPSIFAHNPAYLLPLAVIGLLLLHSAGMTLFCERWLLALLALSPMVHAWYFTWLIPFAVATRNAGSIAVSVSAFAYFGISALPGAPRDGWPLLFLENGIVWLPLFFGFGWSEYQRIRGIAEQTSRIPEYVRGLRLSSS
jgi:alpha-1,6-mannosyltransferase